MTIERSEIAEAAKQTRIIRQIKIDRERCIGCGSCAVLAPDAFVVDPNEGKAKVKAGWEKVPPEDLRRAREACPVQAITIEEG